MRTGTTVAIVAVGAVIVAGLIYMVDIDQTSTGRMPDVDVSVDNGELPGFDADVGSVDVGSSETQVTVPDVDISTEEKTVSVPTLRVTPPEDERQASINE